MTGYSVGMTISVAMRRELCDLFFVAIRIGPAPLTLCKLRIAVDSVEVPGLQKFGK